ncbi:hypothetical protein ACRRVD_03955 [Candidatus Cardinium hertigii]|uniref:hypothetical protein n=1 Tax=Candidatus Cardinium hertigii TaxID=247481 RepID=UPI003D7D9B1C
MDGQLLDQHEAMERSGRPSPISKDEAVNKLKKMVRPVKSDELEEWKKDCRDKQCAMCKEECIVCRSEFNEDDCYALTTGCECKQTAFHIDCMANALVSSYDNMAGKCKNPEYKCPFCKKCLF